MEGFAGSLTHYLVGFVQRSPFITVVRHRERISAASMLAYDHAQIDFALFKVILDRKRDDLTTDSVLLDLIKIENKMENESEYICSVYCTV